MSKKSRRRLIYGLIMATLVIMQFFRPEKNLGELETAEDFMQATGVPDTLARVIMISCYDCHSNFTKYPWYGNVAPISWFLDHHVVEGKAHLNFSSWGLMDKASRISQLDEICSECTDEKMPLKSYLWMHPDSELSKREIEAICTWAEQEALEIMNNE